MAEKNRTSVLTRLRNSFLAGVLITAPIGITVYLAWLFIDYVDSKIKPLIPLKYNPETYLPYSIPGIGLIVSIAVLILIGTLAKGLLGRIIIRTSETIMARIPVIRGVYGALKQIMETVFANKSTAFRQVVLVEYPRRGVWSIGFITGTTLGEVQERTEATTVNVFLPTTPNPTSGYLLFLPKEDVTVLDMTVEEGIKMVVSGGIVVPPQRKNGRLPEGDTQSQPPRVSQAQEAKAVPPDSN